MKTSFFLIVTNKTWPKTIFNLHNEIWQLTLVSVDQHRLPVMAVYNSEFTYKPLKCVWICSDLKELVPMLTGHYSEQKEFAF